MMAPNPHVVSCKNPLKLLWRGGKVKKNKRRCVKGEKRIERRGVRIRIRSMEHERKHDKRSGKKNMLSRTEAKPPPMMPPRMVVLYQRCLSMRTTDEM
jgi:hypothetical protein